MLLNLCGATSQSTHTAHVQAQAMALFAQLLLQEGGVAPLTPAIEPCVGLDDVASLDCSLALAQAYLSNGKVSLLVSNRVIMGRWVYRVSGCLGLLGLRAPQTPQGCWVSGPLVCWNPAFISVVC